MNKTQPLNSEEADQQILYGAVIGLIKTIKSLKYNLELLRKNELTDSQKQEIWSFCERLWSDQDYYSSFIPEDLADMLMGHIAMSNQLSAASIRTAPPLYLNGGD